MDEPAFARVIEQGLALQSRLHGLKLVAVGGLAAALHCDHRYALNVDCASPQIATHFSDAADLLESWDGWKTLRKHQPNIILGTRDGVELAVRQSHREMPLQTTTVKGLCIPTIREMLRVKAFLMIERRATRDYVDFAALATQLEEEAGLKALGYLNCLYGGSGIQTVVTRLAEACEVQPLDLQVVPLGSYRGLRSPFTNWSFVSERCRRFGRQLIKRELNHQLPSVLDAGFFETPQPK